MSSVLVLVHKSVKTILHYSILVADVVADLVVDYRNDMFAAA